MRKTLHHKSRLLLLLFLTMLLSESTYAQADTAYFTKDWFRCEQENAKFYRVLEQADTLLKVTDYYMKGGVQSTGFVENSKANQEILKIRGDFEHRTVGDWKYYFKNGFMYCKTNMRPFHETYGIDSSYCALLDGADSMEFDASQLEFETYYFRNREGYGFMYGEDLAHGTWIYLHSKTRTILNRTRYSNNKLDGVSLVYWKNGNLKKESPYTDDMLHGEQRMYNKKGILVKSKEFENGVLIETWLYKKPKKK